MNTEEKISQEFGEITGYDDVFKTVETIDTISKEENKNWSLKELERLLFSSFKKAGQKALKDNSGVIYTTLSGGLDSTLSLALLRKSLGPEVKIVTFTMGGNEEHPDIKYGRLAAKRFKTEHHEFIPTPDEIHAGLEDFKKDRSNEDLEKAVLRGSFDVYLLYKYLSRFQPKTIIVHDGIDEQMGGYWAHRKKMPEDGRREQFRILWKELRLEQLDQLIKSSQRFGIHLLFPYLDEKLVSFIARIPVEDRVREEIGKIPLREIARGLKVPKGIINRRKRGAVGMTEVEELRKLSK
jgi:asparagine synthetase B (glutamine-hydrolysing)